MTIIQSGREPPPEATLPAGSAFHETLAASWSLGYSGGSFRRRLDFFRPRLDAHVRVGQTWLDAGCGSGVLARELAARGADVIALDGSPAMLAEARRVGALPGQNIRYDLVSSIEQLPLPDAVVDGIMCSSVLEYVGSPTVTLVEFHRVLRPGGILMLTVPNRFSAIRGTQATIRALGRLVGCSAYDYLSVSRHSYSRSALHGALDRTGFEVEESSLFSPRLRQVFVPLGLGALWLAVARRRESSPSA